MPTSSSINFSNPLLNPSVPVATLMSWLWGSEITYDLYSRKRSKTFWSSQLCWQVFGHRNRCLQINRTINLIPPKELFVSQLGISKVNLSPPGPLVHSRLLLITQCLLGCNLQERFVRVKLSARSNLQLVSILHRFLLTTEIWRINHSSSPT